MNYAYLPLVAANPGLLPLATMSSGGSPYSSLEPDSYMARFFDYWSAATGWRRWMCHILVAFAAILVTAIFYSLIFFLFVPWIVTFTYVFSPLVSIPISIILNAITLWCGHLLLKFWLGY